MDIVPAMAEDVALELIKNYYGIENIKVAKYKCYSSQNLKVTSLDGKEIQYVLRIHTASGILNALEVAIQSNIVQEHLLNNGFNNCTAVKTLNKKTAFEYDVVYNDNKVRKSTIELFNFVPGQSISDSDFSVGEYLNLCKDVGKYIGRMHKCLLEIPPMKTYHEVNDTHIWYTKNAALIKDKISFIKDEKIRNYAFEAIKNFETKVKPMLVDVRKCFNHGDISSGNIIIKNENLKIEICGLIDFEDCHFGALVGDLGVGLAYIMGKGQSLGADALEVGRIFIQNYEKELPLHEEEKLILVDCVLARAVVSTATAQHLISISTLNEATYSHQSKNFPKMIKRICSVEREYVDDYLFSRNG